MHCVVGTTTLIVLIFLLLNDLALSKGVRVSHQDLLLCLQSDLIELGRVVTANASTSRSAEAIVSKAFTVELEATTLATIAWLGCHEHWLDLSIVLPGTGHSRGSLVTSGAATMVLLEILCLLSRLCVSVLTRLDMKCV